MSGNKSPQPVIARLARGETVTYRTSVARILALLPLCLVIGLPLLALLIWMIAASLEQTNGLAMALLNARVWALIVAVAGLLVLAPIGVAIRLSRRERLELTAAGLIARSRATPPDAPLLPWSSIERFSYERGSRLSPGTLMLHLTPAAATGLTLKQVTHAQRMRGGFAIAPKSLYAVLTAAHEHFGASSIPGSHHGQGR